MIDETDRAILRILQANARTSNAEIARQVGIAPSAILERIRKLEERGVITGYTTVVNGAAIGLGLTAFVLIRSSWSTDKDFAKAASAIPEVQEVHHIAGEDCYIVKLHAPDPVALGHLLQERIGTLPGLAGTRTMVVLGTEKEEPSIAIPDTPASPTKGRRAAAR